MTTAPLDAPQDHVATVTRLMDVPARYLFLAHSRPEYLMRWFGPVGYPVTFCEADFREGGAWRMQMTGPDGVPGPFFGGTYHQIVPHNRIVYDDGFEDPGAMGLRHTGKMVFTVTFAEGGGQTTMTVAITYASAAMKAEYQAMGMLEGLASGLDQLAGVAAELARAEAAGGNRLP